VIDTEELALLMTHLTSSEDVLTSNLNRDTGYREGFHGFPQFLQAKGV
jgi:hypothetical protein